MNLPMTDVKFEKAARTSRAFATKALGSPATASVHARLHLGSCCKYSIRTCTTERMTVV